MEARVGTVLLYVPEECREQCAERDGLSHQTRLPLKPQTFRGWRDALGRP